MVIAIPWLYKHLLNCFDLPDPNSIAAGFHVLWGAKLVAIGNIVLGLSSEETDARKEGGTGRAEGEERNTSEGQCAGMGERPNWMEARGGE